MRTGRSHIQSIPENISGYCICLFLTTFFSLLSPAFAMDDHVITFEYYQTSDPAVIKSIKVMESVNSEKRQILHDDMQYADDSSRRTLISLMDIFTWYKVTQYRAAFPQTSLVFSQDIIVKENEATYHGVELPGGNLIVSLDVRSKNNRTIPVAIRIVYNNVNLFSGSVTAYPIDELILLHESYLEIDDDEELDMLFLKITRCPPDLCSEEPEEQSGIEKAVK
jgi:hypothetical protein